MEKKSKTGLVVATVILGILCAVMIAGCIFLYANGSTGKLSQKARETKESDFEETEDVDEDLEYSAEGKGFEIVINESAPAGEDTQGENSDYLCEESNQRELTEDDVTALQSLNVEGLPEDKGIIQMVINEMYARKGYQFEDQAVQAYFDAKTWYQEIAEKTDDMNAVAESMTEIEKANVNFLQAYVQ